MIPQDNRQGCIKGVVDGEGTAIFGGDIRDVEDEGNDV